MTRFRIPDCFLGVNDGNLEQELQRVVIPIAKTELSGSVTINNSGVMLEELDDRYRFHGIDTYGACDLSKEKLDGSRTQDGWIKYLEATGSKWGLYSGPAVIRMLHAVQEKKDSSDTNQKDIAMKVWRLFQEDFGSSKPWMMTSTCLVYQAGSVDRVLHEVGSPNEYSMDGVLRGEGGYLSEATDKEEVARLSFNAGASVVEEVFKGLSGGKRSYLYRLGVQVEKQRRVLLLGSFVDGFGISACSDVDWPARGWARKLI